MASGEVSALDGSGLALRAAGGLAIANARYWTTVAPLVRRRVSHWEEHAAAIPDPVLQAAAVEKLRDTRFNIDTAATLATLAPRRHRATTAEAIVALEVLSDYLDGLGEVPLREPIEDGRRLFKALTDAIATAGEPSHDYYARYPQSDDGGYLAALITAVRGALAKLPARDAVAETMTHAGARSAEAQLRTHAVASLGRAQVEDWARAEAPVTGVGWREFLAGAGSSVIAVHALTAAAANRRVTPQQAEQIDAAYLSASALATMLDCLVDYERDLSEGRLEIGYMQMYEDEATFAGELATVARRAVRRARVAPNGAHHVMTIVGIAAYYTSEPGATGSFAAPIAERIQRELRPVITPTLAVMHAWRAARRLSSAWRTSDDATIVPERPVSARQPLDAAGRVRSR